MSSDALQDARAEAIPALLAADKRIERLIKTAHEDEKRAFDELVRLLKTPKGIERVIKILGSDMKRRLHFGPMKGAFLVKGSKVQSLAALAELPEALQERQLLAGRADDLTKAHRQALEKEDREFFEERAHAREQGREVPTREQYMERRRKRR